MLKIRHEKSEEREIVAQINRQAFGDETESTLVASIRESEHFIPQLSLVAERDGRVVGHILFSPISIQQSDVTHPALALAPMAVLPDFQRRGIGAALIRRGLEECKRLKQQVVVLIGHPEYYPRFGFKPAREYGLSLDFDVPGEAFMVLELEKGALKKIGGVVKYPPAFNTET
ncbi:MAG: N-acetyltransferase [Candidatus Krumholzibacteriota bacterium]|nr:N-acetyltransferase [Candidatus Krumholzibacteriota bacterium]